MQNKIWTQAQAEELKSFRSLLSLIRERQEGVTRVAQEATANLLMLEAKLTRLAMRTNAVEFQLEGKLGAEQILKHAELIKRQYTPLARTQQLQLQALALVPLLNQKADVAALDQALQEGDARFNQLLGRVPEAVNQAVSHSLSNYLSDYWDSSRLQNKLYQVRRLFQKSLTTQLGPLDARLCQLDERTSSFSKQIQTLSLELRECQMKETKNEWAGQIEQLGSAINDLGARLEDRIGSVQSGSNKRCEQNSKSIKLLSQKISSVSQLQHRLNEQLAAQELQFGQQFAKLQDRLRDWCADSLKREQQISCETARQRESIQMMHNSIGQAKCSLQDCKKDLAQLRQRTRADRLFGAIEDRLKARVQQEVKKQVQLSLRLEQPKEKPAERQREVEPGRRSQRDERIVVLEQRMEVLRETLASKADRLQFNLRLNQQFATKQMLYHLRMRIDQLREGGSANATEKHLAESEATRAYQSRRLRVKRSSDLRQRWTGLAEGKDESADQKVAPFFFESGHLDRPCLGSYQAQYLNLSLQVGGQRGKPSRTPLTSRRVRRQPPP